MMQPFKKVYRGPQADAATFATQQEFLDSLVPVPVESVDENSRTCAHCWRSYGESTPGEDDAEAPVRFRCNHVFGEQCMRSLFGIREPVRVDLTPLSFAPGSRGADLGKRLSAYVDSHGVEKSALLTGGNREKDFARLLHEAMPAVRSFGDQPPQGRGFDLLGKDWVGFVSQMFMHADHQPGNFELMENAIIMDSVRTEPQEHTAHPNPFLFGAMLPTPSPYTPNLLFDPLNDSLGMYGIPPSYPAWGQGEQKTKEKQEADSSTSATEKDVLSSKSKLDSLVQMHKELEQKVGQSFDSLAEKQKDPQQPEEHSSNGLFILNKELQQEQKQLEEQADNDAGEEEVAKGPGNPPSMAKTQTTSATRAKMLARQKAEEKQRIKNFVKQVARSFAQVYEAYERYQYETAVAAGMPPPVKKLRLADPNKTPLASPVDEVDYTEEDEVRSPVFVLTAIVHENSMNAKGLQVMQPYSYEYLMTQDMDEDDEEEDGVVDAERAPSVLAGKTILLKRKTCQNCSAKSTSLQTSLTTPEYVFWPDSKKIPDNCPKCRRILFKRD